MSNTIKNIAIAAAAMLGTACGPMSDGPLDMHDLQGRWCDETDICLVVERATYRWSTPTCTEEGALSGALEFDPVLSGLCWFPGQAPSLYSASVYYSGEGITLELASPEGEDGPIVKLEAAP
jgi:hypothetical protein